MKELKPCPFCGCDADIISAYFYTLADDDTQAIGCVNDRFECVKPFIIIKQHTSSPFENIMKAVNLWNTRA